jgi:TolB-like protein/DNA-binding winged helix-turn-helix (wHTH) protein/Flp pilus assembly protein TadD
MLAFSCRCNDLESLALWRNGENEYSLAPCNEGTPVANEPARIGGTIRFGGDYELDVRAYELRRCGRAIRLERIPMEVLLLLAEKNGQLVNREQIAERIWGKEVFLDTDNSINGAIRKLRQALHDDPEKPRIIQTVTGKGYRFIADVVEHDVVVPRPSEREAVEGHAGDIARLSERDAGDVSRSAFLVTESAGPEEKPEAKGEVDTKLRSRRGPLLLGLALALVAGLAIYLEWSRARSGPAAGRLTLAVLPFENLTGDPAQEYFSDGLTEEMISRLGNLEPERLAVIARTSVMHYKNTQAPLDQIGRDLRVDYLLEGSVRREANRVRISAQLIQMSDRTHLWARQYDRELSSLLAVQEEIAQAVANEIDLTLTPGNRINGRPTPLSPEALEAYDLYLKGRYFWNKRSPEGFQQAVEHFHRAVEKDPTYARAYAGLADSYALMSSYDFGSPEELIPKARSAALRALELDDRLAEAHTSLALVDENYDWDWGAAEKEFRRAIQLNPNYATAHQWYAELLSFQGRFEKALAESERARQLDPLSLIIATDHGTILYFARQYDRSIEQFRAVIERDPTFLKANAVVGAYEQKGMFPEALSQIDHWRRVSDEPWIWAQQACVYGRLGRRAEARREVAKLEELARQRPSDPMPMLAVAYVGVNEKEKALAWLENKVLRERSNYMLTLRVEPVWDPLREDPRFQELVRRAGLAK